MKSHVDGARNGVGKFEEGGERGRDSVGDASLLECGEGESLCEGLWRGVLKARVAVNDDAVNC